MIKDWGISYNYADLGYDIIEKFDNYESFQKYLNQCQAEWG